MRLTKSDRDAFVRAAMDDVPAVNYGDKAKRIVMDYLKATVPVDLQNCIAKHPNWFQHHRVAMPLHLGDFNTALVAGYTKHDSLPAQIRDAVKELGALAKEQAVKRNELEEKLAAAIAQFTTLKAAKKALPEFEKYLPADRDGVVDRSMPVVANLVADLTNAGWPKEKGNGKEAAA